MKKYSMSFARFTEHIPEHPERTAYRSGGSLDFDTYLQVWPSAAAMAKTIEMQSRSPPHPSHWKPWLSSRLASHLVEKRSKSAPPKGHQHGLRCIEVIGGELICKLEKDMGPQNLKRLWTVAHLGAEKQFIQNMGQYRTQEDAEKAAERLREKASNQGWNLYFDVQEITSKGK